MKAWDDNKIENLIRSSAFPNPAHKHALRERLFEAIVVLSPEDLDVAGGGTEQPKPESRELWRTDGKIGK